MLSNRQPKIGLGENTLKGHREGLQIDHKVGINVNIFT